jgi:hypothetical protein
LGGVLFESQNSFENINGFNHKVFTTGFLEDSIIDFPVYAAPSSAAKVFRNDLQPHESPQAFKERLCSWHANGAPTSNEALEGFVSLLLRGVSRRVSSRQGRKRAAR